MTRERVMKAVEELEASMSEFGDEVGMPGIPSNPFLRATVTSLLDKLEKMGQAPVGSDNSLE